MIEKPRGKKQPKHFKVHCSIQNHEKTAAMSADNDLFALYVRLGILAVERFADRTGGTFIISDRELPRLTGKGRLDVARTLLSRLAHVSPTSASREGDIWRITLPNFAKKQGFAEKMNHFRESPSSSSSSPSVEERANAPSAPSGGSDLTPDPGQLANVLSPYDGDPDEKRAWLEHEWPLIHAEAQADPKPGRVVPIAIRFYRAYIARGPEPGRPYRKFEKWAEKQETRRRVAEHEAKFAADIAALEAEEGYAAAHR